MAPRQSSPRLTTHAILAVLLLASTTLATTHPNEDDWLIQTERWREAREQQLLSADGWLAVTGLHWLRDGQFRFGSAHDCEIQLAPGSAPPLAGSLNVTNGLVTFSALNSAALTLNHNPVNQGRLTLPSPLPEADSTDRLHIGASSLQLLRRSGKLAIRVRDSNSPRRRNFTGERWFPPNPAWNLHARFIPANPGTFIQLQNVRGATLQQELAGLVEFTYQNKVLQLQAIAEDPESLFIVFRDQTSGQVSWPGGRFLSFTRPPDHSSFLLDFNRAHNPPCAYTPHTLCPLPTRQNTLPIAVNAGALRPQENP